MGKKIDYNPKSELDIIRNVIDCADIQDIVDCLNEEIGPLMDKKEYNEKLKLWVKHWQYPK